MRLSLASLVFLLLASTAAFAQSERGEITEIPVEKLGNFEIQDLMVSIRYGEARRGARSVPAQITVKSPDGDRLGLRQLYLGGALGDEISTIALRMGEDGTLTGEGMLPPPSQVEAFQLRMDPDGKLGFNIGMPPTVRGDFRGGAQGEGWKVEVSMDWPLDVDIVIEG